MYVFCERIYVVDIIEMKTIGKKRNGKYVDTNFLEGKNQKDKRIKRQSPYGVIHSKGHKSRSIQCFFRDGTYENIGGIRRKYTVRKKERKKSKRKMSCHKKNRIYKKNSPSKGIKVSKVDDYT